MSDNVFSTSNEGQSAMVNSKKGKMLVAAIDFGTTFSGYAFCAKANYEKKPPKISLNQNWVAGSMSLISPKAPTSVLFDKQENFNSFGFDAEDKYANLALDKEHKGWRFFSRFKMGLHKKEISKDMEIKDDQGRPMKALKVFGAVINYLKGHLLKLNEKRASGFENKDIHWILTVPAIWKEPAKQFMRKAANSAGIDNEQLTIALEPETASLYCQLTQNEDTDGDGSDDAKSAMGVTGTKYMVIDLGGGTADITVHEKQQDGTLKEITKATGGAWGGTKVDEEFYQMLIRIIGAPVFTKFCEDHKPDHLDLQRELETKKRTITPQSSGKITIKVPRMIAKTYKKEMKEPVMEAVEQTRYKGKMTWDNDKLRINAEIFQGLFKPCSEQIVSHIKDLLEMPKVKGTNIFLMVGGFSESAMMQNAIEEAFPDVKVIIPEDAGLTVLKGAVVFGHSPGIESRISRYTYGINISPPFDPEKHPVDHRVSVGGVDRCRDVFKQYIREGETIKVHEPKSGKHVTLKSRQKEMLLKIFATPKRDPAFVDEDDIEYLGNVIVNLPETEDKIRVEVKMMFGETEVSVEAEELATHQKFKAYFDFL